MFETLYIGEEEVTSHTDIEDEGQTVAFVEGPKMAPLPPWTASIPPTPQEKSPSWDVVEYTGLTPW